METELSRFLIRKFREWEDSTRHKQSVSAFARHLGVKQPTLNKWINGDTTPDYEYVLLLADKFGDEVFDVLGLQRPEDDYSAFPPEVAAVLRSARRRIEAELRRTGVASGSAAGLEIAKRILSEYGVTINSNAKPEG